MKRGIDFNMAGVALEPGDSVDGLITVGAFRVVGKFKATLNR